MKAVILAGGRGTRLSEETVTKPKPLVEAGGKPLLWHIMKNYSNHGINDFVVLSGYKGHLIREYFANYWLHQSDITFDLSEENLVIHKKRGPSWRVTVIDTGLDTQTGGRLNYLREIIPNEDFFLTYGDGVADVDISKLLALHQKMGRLVTLTAVQPPARFGALRVSENLVESFEEKPISQEALVNGGFFVLKSSVLENLPESDFSFESDFLPELARSNQLSSYFHGGFWQPVDTIRDLSRLEKYLSVSGFPWSTLDDRS
jgi:glucose-1-phosphate cytidylyltransferase